MNKNPTMKKASENISNIFNPKETDYQRAMRIKKEISDSLGELK